MCRIERWSVRTLRKKIDGMLFERTAIAKKPEEVIGFHDDALARAREANSKVAESSILSFKGLYISTLGRTYQGNTMAAEAERMALETQDPLAIAGCRIVYALSERWLGRPSKTIEMTDKLFEAISGAFFMRILSGLIFIRGTALAEYGRIKQAVETLTYGIDICEKFGGMLHLGHAL